MMLAIAASETSADSKNGPQPNSPEKVFSKSSDSGCESLRQFIIRLYGEEIHRQIRQLENFRLKKIHLLCSLTFLLRCRDSKVVPKFLKMKRIFKTPQSLRIYERMEFALLRERIHTTRKSLAILDEKLVSLHLLLSNRLKTCDWDNIDRLIQYKVDRRQVQCSSNQKKKFELSYKNCKVKDDNNRTIINLSDHHLSSEEHSVLSKGFNFAITPSVIPIEDIISQTEAAIRELPPDAAEEIRSECSRILQRAKPPQSNIASKERQAIKKLNRDKDILILPADKGNATVIMKTTDYNGKILDILNTNDYKKVTRDPTAQILRKTNQLIRSSTLHTDTKKRLYKSEALPPRLYGLPKIHKKEIPLRPIVSAIGSPTYNISKHLSHLLQPHIGKTSSYIRDSAHFIEKINQLKIDDNDLLVSFDVVSLFTKVPINDTLQHIEQLFSPDITSLYRQCLSTSYFQWNKEFYEQTDGVAMGSPLSPVVANFFMEKFEKQALDTAKLKPTIWLRYVDDTFVIWSHGKDELQRFLEHINSIHSNISFTMEKEKDGKLAFLDVLISRGNDHKLHHRVHRKPTHTDRYLHKDSNHHPSQKRGIIKTLTERARRICEPVYLSSEMNHLQLALQNNGYSRNYIKRAIRPPRRSVRKDEETPKGTAVLPYINRVTDRIGKLMRKHNIRTCFMPTNKIGDLLRSAKDTRDPLTSAGVYRIPCNCGDVYIGTTKRSVNTRLKEHMRHCRQIETEKSAVADHMWGQNHKILFDETQLLSNVTHYSTRIYREAIEIQKHKNSFNKKEES